MATAKEKREAAKERENDLQRQLAESERKRKEAEDALAKGKTLQTSEQIEALNKHTTIHPDLTPNAHGSQAQPSVAGGKCVVGCKIALAYIDLQLCEMRDKDEQTQTGVRTIKEAVRVGNVVRIRGTSYPRGTPPKGFPPPPTIVAGCAMNPNVDRDFMREYMKQNERSAFVQNRMIFMADDENEAAAIARELAGQLSGFEPVNTDGDPRMPKPTNKDVGELEAGSRT